MALCSYCNPSVLKRYNQLREVSLHGICFCLSQKMSSGRTAKWNDQGPAVSRSWAKKFTLAWPHLATSAGSLTCRTSDCSFETKCLAACVPACPGDLGIKWNLEDRCGVISALAQLTQEDGELETRTGYQASFCVWRGNCGRQDLIPCGSLHAPPPPPNPHRLLSSKVSFSVERPSRSKPLGGHGVWART